MYIELLGAKHLSGDTQCWSLEPRFNTMEIHAHEFLFLGVWFSRILRGILCLSITGAQPLAIGLSRWPQ
jgi:hypothetical protein